jgi:hypothetical protein
VSDLRDYVFKLAAQRMRTVFEPCRLPGCQKLSLGFICARCSRYVCQHHAYVKASPKPETICASCVVDEHPELWEEEERQS